MFKNYIKTALRNFLKHKGINFINVFGLAMGIASSLVIFRYVAFETSYDQFHPDSENIYRVIHQINKELILARTPSYIGTAMQQEFPEVTSFCQIRPWEYDIISFRDEEGNITELRQVFCFADASSVDFFSLELLAGDKTAPLAEKGTAMISQSLAKKYFGDTEAVGKILTRNAGELYRITSIFKDLPENSHMKLNLLLSSVGDNWAMQNLPPYTYVKLMEGSEPGDLTEKLQAMVFNHEGNDSKSQYTLLPLEKIHLYINSTYENIQGEVWAHGNYIAVYSLLIVAIIILLIACINYTNMTTSSAIERTKEVGLRKAIGAQRKQLIEQFLWESFIAVMVAVLLAFLMIVCSLNFINNLSETKFLTQIWSDIYFWLTLIGIVAACTLLSGFYPAFILSSFKPAHVIKGKPVAWGSGQFFQKGLVVFQFFVTTALIIFIVTVYHQINYMQEKGPGINTHQILVIKGPRVKGENYSLNVNGFKNALLQYPAIVNVATSNNVPSTERSPRDIRKLTDDPEEMIWTYYTRVDYDFMLVFDLKIKAGRFFAKEYPHDKNRIILNETAVKLLGYLNAQEVIGEKIIYSGTEREVIGVIEDYHHQGLQQAILPATFELDPDYAVFFSLELNHQALSRAGELKDVISLIQSEYRKTFINNPFDYFFLDEAFDAQYKADCQFETIFTIFTGLAIFISFLGLMALAFFTTKQRTKEIGIRKVLGASVASILVLLSKDYVKLICIAFIVAIPVANYFMSEWLKAFAYRIEIQWGLFALPGMMVLLIALLSVSSQSWKAARRNPVDSLRYE